MQSRRSQQCSQQVAQAVLNNSSAASYEQMKDTIKASDATLQSYMKEIRNEVTDKNGPKINRFAIKTYNPIILF
jgi:hypothetical protein